jgi:hypothetical protein
MAQYVAVRALHRSANIRVTRAHTRYVLTVAASAGQFGLTVSNQTAGASDSTANTLAYNISAADLKTAIAGLSTAPELTTSNVNVTGGPGDAGGTTPYTIEFYGDAGDTDYILSVNTGGTPLTGSASVSTTGRQVKLSPTVDTVVDLTRTSNQRALTRHSAIGQWVITATNDDIGGNALPANS